MSDFLKKLSRDPFAPIDGASIVSVDELGNGYDYRGTLIAPKFEAPQQTWGETALGVATAPARIATALAGSLSPYGADGWQVPPIVHEGVNALTAVGDAYNYGMTDDEINSRALGMAGFMMGGGGLAAKSPVSRAANLFPDQPRAMSADLFAEAVPAGERFGARTAADASKESSIPAIASALEQKGARPEPSALPQGRSDGVSDVLAEPVDYNAWLDRVQASVDDGAEGPFFGPANPEAVTGTALQDIARQSYQKEMDYNGWPNELTGDQPPHAAIASSLRDAAEATGRSLDIYGDERFPFKSAYGTLRTPAENTYKVRIADHANTTAYHGKPDFNIAPGAMTPEEFIDLLPAIYSNSDSRPALLASALDSLSSAYAHDSSLYMFGGRNAKTADLKRLAVAERLAAEGADRNAIWNETGWFQGPDQKWRFEIDDSAASFSPPGSTFAEIYDNASGFKSMGDVLSHQNLYGAYPDTADLGLGISKGDVYGSFGGRGVNDLDIKGSSPRGEAMETLLHEGQHAIQATEGFARGGNRSMFGPDEIAAERARVNTPEPNDWSGIGGGYGDAPDTDVALGLYERLAGEVEARNVQTRMNMSADQRRATPPWETQDIPDIDQIARLSSNAPKQGPIPALASALEQKGARPEPSANALSSELSGTGFYPLSGGAETGTYLAFDDIPGNAPSPKQQQVRQMAAGHQGRMRSHPGQQAPEGLSSKMGGQELDSSGTPIGSFLDRSHYPRTGLNPIHEVHNWAKVRSMARKAINGEHVPGYLYDGLNGNGNLLAGTHRAAANELLDILGYGKRIKSANINDVLDEPEAYGLSARNADRLRQAAEDGDYRLIDEIWDQSRDTSLFSNSDSRPALLASALGQEEGYADGGSVGLPSPYSIAKTMEGQREGRGNDLLNRFLNGDTAGMTSAEYAWCSRFVKKAAAQSGVDVSGATDMARSWLKVGQPVDDPDLGDVVVLSRGDPNSQYGHVGFYEGTNPDGSVRILSGNHNNAVASASYPSERVLGYRRLGEGQSEAYDPATGQYGMKPLAMVDGVGREPRPLPRPTSSQATEVADSQQSKPSFDLMKLASLFSEPDQAPAPQVQLTPIQAFQSQGAPIQAATPYRATFAHGGQVRGLPDGSEPIHAGPLHSTVPGRTDHLPITVAAGSFVLPADIVSSLGEGNTNAGMETVSQMFPLPPVRRADGGRVPIAAAGGEFVIAPETVAALGNGDLDVGHELLDQFVRRTRAQNIQRLRALPGPEK